MKILVTGGCGWLGSAIVDALLSRGDTVIATDLAVSPATAERAGRESRLTTLAADLGEWHQIVRLFEQHRPDAVIHTAAIVGVVQTADIPIKAQRVNVEGSINLFEAMRLCGAKRVVHISSEETYGNFLSAMIDEDHPQRPLSVYGVTKLAVEHYGRLYSRYHGLECINVRTCMVYGAYMPRLRMPRTFVEAALRGDALHVPDGGAVAVDQVYIDDTVQGVLLTLDKPEHKYDAYNVATGISPTLRDTADAVNRAVPGAQISVGDRGLGRYRSRTSGVVKGALDISRARIELGYEPRFDLQQGIEATIAATRARTNQDAR